MSEHREWNLGGSEAAEAYLRDLSQEHNALFKAWEVERDRATNMLAENNRLDRELDEARQALKALESRPVLSWEECEAKYTELIDRDETDAASDYFDFRVWLKSRLPAPIRVPFSDAQIEAMAKAVEDCYEIDPDATFESAIRAALAAGGLEPCAVPEYDPADVALRPERASDEELANCMLSAAESFWFANLTTDMLTPDYRRDAVRIAAAVRARVESPLLAEIERLTQATAAVQAERDRVLSQLEHRVGRDEIVARDVLRQRLNVPEADWATSYMSAALDERDTLKARVAELEAEAEANIEWQETMVLDLKRKDAELEAAKAERDQWKRKNHCYFVEVEELKKELAALRQPVDPDAWMTPLDVVGESGAFSYGFEIHNETPCLRYTSPACGDHWIVMTPCNAVKLSAHLASYANAHGCPVSLGQPIHPPLDATKPKTEQGIYNKFNVSRTDGSDAPGCKHDGCQYFVLDRTHDKFAAPALTAYGLACATEYPELSRELLSAYPAPETRKAKVNGYDFTAHDLDTWMQKELNWSTTPEKAVKLMNYMAAHAHAVIDVPQGVPSVGELDSIAKQVFDANEGPYAAATAIRDAVLAGVAGHAIRCGHCGSEPCKCCATTPHDPSAAEVEALARVLCRADCEDRDGEDSWDEGMQSICESYRREARAAFAHIGKPARSNAEMQVCVNRKNRRIDALKAYVRKWKAKTNEPATGWELDVTAGELWDAYDKAGGGNSGSWQAVVDLCRSRIRPTFGPCQECAKVKAERDAFCRSWDDCRNRLCVIRNLCAALEGECQECAGAEDNWREVSAAVDGIQSAVNAARAALEGE